MKSLLGISGAAALTLIIVVTANTMRISSPSDTTVPPALDVPFDIDGAAGRLAEMIRIRTISNGVETPVEAEAFRDFRAYLQNTYPGVHEVLQREIIGEHSLLYTWTGTDLELAPILLMAHMDVAPIEPGTLPDWTHPPFAGTIANGFIWGRGTLDMKVSIGGIMEAVAYLVAQDFTPTRTVYLAFSHDEELAGPNGTASIVQTLDDRGIRLLFTIDEGMPVTQGVVPGVDRSVALIGLAEKGRVTLEIVARGDGGHSSLPPVSTAVGRLGAAMYRLETNQMPRRLHPLIVETLSELAPEMPLLRRVAIANIWLFRPALLSILEKTPAGNASIRTTTAPTMVTGGVKPNVLPTKARAVVDFRILPGDTVASVIEHVKNTIGDPELDVREIGNKGSDPTPVSDSNATSFGVIRQTIRQVMPDVVIAPGLVIGRTDSHHYRDIAISSYRFLPMRLGKEDLQRIHGTDERIGVENYREIVRFYAQLIWNVNVMALEDEVVVQ